MKEIVLTETSLSRSATNLTVASFSSTTPLKVKSTFPSALTVLWASSVELFTRRDKVSIPPVEAVIVNVPISTASATETVPSAITTSSEPAAASIVAASFLLVSFTSLPLKV